MMKTHLVLQKYVQRKKKSVKGFSIRRLAANLDISAPFLSRILSGQRPIPYALLLKIAKELKIESEVLMTLKEAHQVELQEGKVPRRGRTEVKTPLEDWELAPEASHRVLRNWFYVPILDLTSLPDFDGSAKMVAQRLGLSLTVAEMALRDLVSLGLIEMRDGRAKKAARKMRFSAMTSLDDIRYFHRTMLEKAAQELKNATSEKDFQRRLMTGITMTASSKKIEKMKKKLADCLHEIANELTEDEGDEIYHLSAQLFPLTKLKS